MNAIESIPMQASSQLPPQGPFSYSDLQALNLVRKGYTPPKGFIKNGMTWSEADVPMSRLQDLLDGEKARGSCNLSLKRKHKRMVAPGLQCRMDEHEDGELEEEDEAAHSAPCNQRETYKHCYDCQYGPWKALAAQDPTVLKKPGLKTRRSKSLAGESIRVGCQYRLDVTISRAQRAAEGEQMVTVR